MIQESETTLSRSTNKPARAEADTELIVATKEDASLPKYATEIDLCMPNLNEDSKRELIVCQEERRFLCAAVLTETPVQR